MYDINEVKAVDPEICEAINEELYRQQHNIELIASENIVSKAVMAAMGSVLQINMQKVTQVRDITVVAKRLIL